jgi:adenine-specific DNA-methyltransferase
MAHEKLKPSFVFDEEKIEKLKQLAPECFEDGKINFETLKQNMGEWAEYEDESLEHFGLFWPGKKMARRAATLPPEGTLEPVFGEGLKPDGSSDEDGINPSKNIFIEGENLEVLKLLQKSYADKIKMIYIDPPYNTGNDFVYDDDFTEPLNEYIRRTGQIDEEGKALTTNKRSDGRFHSKWLSMMYPRLRLARNLLKDDGVIFVSIDDNEVHNLREIMNELFGEECFLGQITWLKKRKGSFLSKKMISLTEYCLVYSKNVDNKLYGGDPDKSESQPLIKRTNSQVELLFPAKSINTKLNDGKYQKGIYGESSSSVEVLNDFEIKKGVIVNEVIVKGPFIWGQEYLNEQLTNGAQLVVNTLNFQVRAFKAENEGEFKGMPSFINGVEIGGTNEDAYEYLKKEFGRDRIFDYTKPVNYLKKLIDAVMHFDNEGYILDFFAGSGSTGHALWKANIEEDRDNKWILVQFPELLEEGNKEQKDPFEFCKENNLNFYLSEITKERLRRVHHRLNLNSGFKCFKLNNSNFKSWTDFQGQNIAQLTAQFEEVANSPFATDWNKNKLFTEIILLEGFPLDAQVEELNIGENAIKKVTSELVSNQLLICLDEQISTSLITDLKIDHNSSFICLDSAISNQDKLRLSDKGLIKTI